MPRTQILKQPQKYIYIYIVLERERANKRKTWEVYVPYVGQKAKQAHAEAVELQSGLSGDEELQVHSTTFELYHGHHFPQILRACIFTVNIYNVPP